MRPVETLHALSEKTGPGRTPEFTSAHVLIALGVIRIRSPGRKQLSADLSLGEGTARNLLRRLTDEGLVSSTRQGVMLTEEGVSLLEEFMNLIRGTPVPRTRLTVGDYNYAVLVKGGASKVRLGVEQRDKALFSGASGATTMVFKEGRLMIPALPDDVEPSLVESIMTLSPEDGDAVIIGTACSFFLAKLGAYAAGLDLLS